MLIGNNECYLRIERADDRDWYSPYRLEARVRYGDDAEFFVVNTLAIVSAGEQEHAAFVDFSELRSHRVLFALSEKGSLELRRDARGNIDILFTIGYRRLGPIGRQAAMFASTASTRRVSCMSSESSFFREQRDGLPRDRTPDRRLGWTRSCS